LSKKWYDMGMRIAITAGLLLVLFKEVISICIV
jgi:hypothetical protein